MAEAPRRGRSRGQTGSMAVEMVLLAPVLFAMVLIVVAMGRYVAVQGTVEAAAREAARAASLQRDPDGAAAAAAAAATATIPAAADCTSPALGGSFVAGGLVTVSLSCTVSYDGLGLLGLPGSVTIDADSAAPLETYRRVGP